MTTDRQTSTPLAEAMMTLAAALGVEIVWPDDRAPTADELRALPSTNRLEAELTRRRADLDLWGSGRTSGLGWEHRTLMVRVAERQVRWGWVRDRLVANQTDECQCYGDGKVLMPAIVNPETNQEIEPSYWRYCGCQAGDRLRALNDRSLEEYRAIRTAMLLSGIFDFSEDDFAEYIEVTLDTYRDRLAAYPTTTVKRGRAIILDLRLWPADRGAPWLVLHGPTGTGKTGLAVSALKEAATRGKRGLILREKALLDRIRATYDRPRGSDEPTESSVLDELRRVPILALDDVGAPGNATTDWAQGQLFDVFNARYSARRQTIITTNLEPRTLADYLGPRIWSRLRERTDGERWILSVNEPDLRAVGVGR